MIEQDIFESVDVNYGPENFKIIIQQKRVGNQFRIDVRLWMKKDSGEYIPLKKGICFENKVFLNQIVPELNRLLEKYV